MNQICSTKSHDRSRAACHEQLKLKFLSPCFSVRTFFWKISRKVYLKNNIGRILGFCSSVHRFCHFPFSFIFQESLSVPQLVIFFGGWKARWGGWRGNSSLTPRVKKLLSDLLKDLILKCSENHWSEGEIGWLTLLCQSSTSLHPVNSTPTPSRFSALMGAHHTSIY